MYDSNTENKSAVENEKLITLPFYLLESLWGNSGFILSLQLNNKKTH